MPMDKATRRLPVCPAIQLLLARMDSHPHEFRKYNTNGGHNPLHGRWAEIVGSMSKGDGYNAKEKYLYNRKLRAIRTEEAHERIMKYMLTGDK